MLSVIEAVAPDYAIKYHFLHHCCLIVKLVLKPLKDILIKQEEPMTFVKF